MPKTDINGFKRRSKNVFDPNATKPFKLSRTKLENFVCCPRCFYLDRRLGIGVPPGFPFNLNSAVDHLFKKEFDSYRAQKKPHPLMLQYNIGAIPYQHKDLDTWRENFVGVQYYHEKTNFLLFGAVDDIWEKPDGELIVVDYKSTSINGEITLHDEWKDSYKRQMEIYQWILRRNGFAVSNTGYFVYANGLKDPDGFNDTLLFKTTVLLYTGNDSWIEDTLIRAHECLSSNTIPEYNSECSFCAYQALTHNV
ncbi:MAG: PD-(D/E)XK nuclease family protein [Candidatus Ancaeobacter aquaticus]|nr:PD-(D/E)XK nuclease family protein [Candidatus Ancaeobacter aquaticus]